MTADFSGYATRYNVRCADGRTILPGAFSDNHQTQVPLMYGHDHGDLSQVLGHAILEDRPDGVYAEAFFNESPKGINAKQLVQHGDLKFLSIFANQLTEKAKQVFKGNIRELSLVLAGANPGAYIDNVAVAHSDGEVEIYNDEAIIYTDEEIVLEHAAPAMAGSTQKAKPPASSATGGGSDKTLQEVLDTLDEEQTQAVNFLLSQALATETTVKHDDLDEDETEDENDEAESDSADETEDEGAEDEAEASTEDESDAEDQDPAPADAAATDEAQASEDDSNTDGAGDDVVQHGTTNQEDIRMNVFDTNKPSAAAGHKQHVISHDDVKGIMQATIKSGSLKDSLEDYALSHGIENIDYLFPDAQLVEGSPQFVSRRMEWVDKVLSGVRKSPIPRIKTITADLTADEARARGYITGNMKQEEFFSLSKRETTPQTVYKKQKLDRDDVLDITDLDVVSWLKAEMKVMLDEEIAGAILVGDGRSAGDEDKIREDKIRPIASDAELYVTTVNVNLDDANSSADEIVDAAIANRKYYKGSGLPTFYTTEDIIAKFLTVKDQFGRRLYSNLTEVATVLRVADIVSVEVMERQPGIVGIMVNLSDYTLGTARGGQATMFDDFDLDYNKLRYLLEARMSGALTLPKSALVFRKVAGTDVLRTPVEPNYDEASGTVTVPTVTGVVYKDQNGNTLTNGSPVTLSAGQTLVVQASPTSGSYFATNADDSWTYTKRA